MAGNDSEELMTAHEAASFLRVHVETVRKMARRGEIPSHKVGSDWRFRKRALLDWSERHRVRSAPATMLIISGDRTARDAILEPLDRAGHRLLIADSLELGIERLVEESPCLVFLDAQLVAPEGLAALARLRETHPDLPLVVVVGYSDSGMLHQIAHHPPLMLLAKPVGQRQLDRTVNAALGMRPMSSPGSEA